MKRAGVELRELPARGACGAEAVVTPATQPTIREHAAGLVTAGGNVRERELAVRSVDSGQASARVVSAVRRARAAVLAGIRRAGVHDGDAREHVAWRVF